MRPARAARPCGPGRPARRDCEYRRGGTANVFCAFEPLAGWRRLQVTERRTKLDFAGFVKELLDARYRGAEKVVLVMDQLNTHSPASLYEAFAAAEAKRLADRLEIRHTPKHGRWLNAAEIELSALGKRLPGRPGDVATLAGHVAAVERDRNERRRGCDWQFTADDARVKLKRLYPSTEVR